MKTKNSKIREAVTEPTPELNTGVRKLYEFRKTKNLKKKGKCSKQKSGKP